MYFAVTNTGIEGVDVDLKYVPKARTSSFQYRSTRKRLTMDTLHSANSTPAADNRMERGRGEASPAPISARSGMAIHAKYRTRNPTPTSAASAPPMMTGTDTSTTRRMNGARQPKVFRAA